MKKIIFLFIAAIVVTSCSVEDDSNLQEEVVISSLSESKFINFMEADALGEGLIPEAINPDASVYPLGIESVFAEGELAKNGSFDDPDFGSCIESVFEDPTNGTELGKFAIAKINENNGNGNGNTKFTYEFTTQPGWYVYSVMMNIDEDCSNLPLTAAGLPNVCAFNVRNCFRSGITNVRYKFRDNCLSECTCNSVYVLLYNLDSNGCIDRQVGVWVNGDQFSDTVATTTSFCKSECGDTVIIDD